MKNMPLYLKYHNSKPVGVQSLTNNFGVEILDIIPDYMGEEKAICCFTNGDSRWGIRHVKINYEYGRRPNVRYSGCRYYLGDFIANREV